MEEICTAISAALGGTTDGAYKIYYEEDLFDCLPEDMRNRETLEAALKNLAGGGYIDVKYARSNAFCIASLKKYEIAPKKVEAETDETPPTPVTVTATVSGRQFAYVTLCALLGGAAGGAIAALIGMVL